MRKFYILLASLFLLAGTAFYLKLHSGPSLITVGEDEDEEGYDGPAQRDSLEFAKTVDPALGYVPYNRLFDAINYTEAFKQQLPAARLQAAMAWEERGPIYDSLGPSNGNTRAGVNYTSGRIRAVLVDTLNDPTGNTVFAGGVAGGIWRCTNFLSPVPNWRPLVDFTSNIAIASVCQNPANPSILYFATGEGTSNADAVLGKGIWKSIDAGLTWNWLPSTDTLIRNFRIACDATGNVYVASRPTATPQRNTAGLLRSSDGGATWTNITPAALGTATATATCTDMEISNNGKLYASFGYLGTTVRAYVATNPATVTQSAGWTLGTGIRPSGTAAVRMELAAVADTVYAVTINTAYNTDSCYKSINGGLTWTKQNTTVMPAGLGSGQGWYSITLGINPTKTNEIISGGLDAYRSADAGVTWQQVTYWVTTAPYVHADHHFVQWWNRGAESRILIGSDGGLFLSRDNGVTFIDKNRNLSIKQFYGAAIHPYAGSPYLLAGAQDNGTHQIRYPGLSPSNEVTGGDGAYVHINQQNPQVQFGAYVYNQYRRSLDGGNTWGQINVSASAGMFINPFDHDDAQNILYGCHNANSILRMTNTNVAGTPPNTVVSITALGGAQAAALKVSPYTANRLFIGSNNGRVLQVDGANGTPTATLISGTALPGGFINCVNTGTSDNNLVATFTNYGINNVWVTSDGGANWTAIDGNLPDMPVRWALFEPGRNDRMILATEAGIYTTDLINGSSTLWAPNTTFPTVRTDMLKMRASDSTVVASTHGRGLFTAKISGVVLPQVSFLAASLNTAERTDSTTGCRNYADYTIGIGLTSFANAATTVTVNVLSGSATEGSDYDITTNGSFSSPSKTLSFDANTAVTKYITVRIYDDKEVEPLENLIIGYSVNGSNAVAGLLKTYTLSIEDNDAHPSPYQSGNYSLGTYNADLGVNSPFNGTKLRNRLQVLYTAAELRAAGFTQRGALTALTVRVKSKSSTTPFNGFSVSMMNTAVTGLTTAFLGGNNIMQVYNGNYSTVIGNNTFPFSKPFVWDGSSNLLVQFCYDNTGGTAAAAADSVEGMAAPLGTGVRGSSYSNWTGANVSGCFLTGSITSDARVNATFAGSFGTVVATALNSTGTEWLTARNDNYFYTSDSQVLARITNLSAANYGCTQVTIDRAGTGAVQFWNTDTAAYLMSKTYRIVPAANATTGQTEVTFFFTKAEKEGWEKATGKSWNDIQIIKLPSAIRNVTPQTAQPDGPGTVEVINAVRRSSGPDFYTLSAVFNTGFGGFGFGIPARMNTLLTLTGSLNGNGKDIDLAWTTSAEINSNIFQVEKSYDGVTYHVIGNVPASGNKLTPTTYRFVDGENVADNYYRIKMLHTDGYVLYSNVVYIRKDNAPNDIFVTPNPFADRFNVRFSRTPTGTVTISLFDAGGKLYTRIVRSGGSPSYDVPVTQVMAKGTYLLQVVADGRRYGKKVVRN